MARKQNKHKRAPKSELRNIMINFDSIAGISLAKSQKMTYLMKDYSEYVHYPPIRIIGLFFCLTILNIPSEERSIHIIDNYYINPK